jgi:hypothetical protein
LRGGDVLDLVDEVDFDLASVVEDEEEEAEDPVTLKLRSDMPDIRCSRLIVSTAIITDRNFIFALKVFSRCEVESRPFLLRRSAETLSHG